MLIPKFMRFCLEFFFAFSKKEVQLFRMKYAQCRIRRETGDAATVGGISNGKEFGDEYKFNDDNSRALLAGVWLVFAIRVT